MADGYRFLQQPVGNPVYSQYSSSSSIVNGIILNNLLSRFAAEPPSPSESPRPTSPSKHLRGMYGQNHQQGHNNRLNGAPAGQRGLPIMYNYQQQAHQQHQTHTQHHQAIQASHGGHGMSTNVIDQHATYSTGILANSSPFSTNSTQNGHGGPASRGGQSQQPMTEHLAEQLRLHKEAQNAHNAIMNGQPHYYARLKAGENKAVVQSSEANRSSTPPSGTEEERRRPWSIDDKSKRQDWQNMDLSGQGLRILSPTLFAYTFLVELYIASNKLTSIPAGIGKLRHLRHLEASFNQISELPPEMGMCTNLKQLLLFTNNIEDLPHELGSLYQLDVLGIDGNPLRDDLKEEIKERGTKSLITLLRETAPVPPPPEPRREITIQEDVAQSLERVKVFSWNILCSKYATSQTYGYTPSAALSWDYRKMEILDEMRRRDPDIMCLQEMATDVYREFFTPELGANDYKGIHWPRPKAKTMPEKDAVGVDGCAVFYKASKYILLDKQLIDYANIAINRADMKPYHEVFNRVMPKDNIGIICLFESRATGARMIVVCTHLAWEPTLADVKLVQTTILMEQVAKLSAKYVQQPALKDKKNMQLPLSFEEGHGKHKDLPDPAPSQEYRSNTEIPLFVCGDYNSTENSSVYEFLSTGRVAPDHRELKGYQYGTLTRDGAEHPFSLRSAYMPLKKTPDELTFTNYVPGFQEEIDYIWYSTNTLEVISLLGPTDRSYLQRVPGFPHYHFPADHIQIMAEFTIKQPKSKKLAQHGTPDFGSSR